jgi:hypothetical protein
MEDGVLNGGGHIRTRYQCGKRGWAVYSIMRGLFAKNKLDFL